MWAQPDPLHLKSAVVDYTLELMLWLNWLSWHPAGKKWGTSGDIFNISRIDAEEVISICWPSAMALTRGSLPPLPGLWKELLEKTTGSLVWQLRYSFRSENNKLSIFSLCRKLNLIFLLSLTALLDLRQQGSIPLYLRHLNTVKKMHNQTHDSSIQYFGLEAPKDEVPQQLNCKCLVSLLYIFLLIHNFVFL